MIKAEFLVPVRDNEGHPFPRSHWREFEERLLLFGGFSRESGVTGAWQSDEQVYRDMSRRYVMALASWTEVPAWLALIQWVRKRFREEAIYIEIAGVPEVIGRTGDKRG